MIDDKLLETYENRVAAAMQESEDPIAITADDPSELIEIIRNARRYLALRRMTVTLVSGDAFCFAGKLEELDAATNRLLEGGE